MTDSYITPEMEAAIGRELDRSVSHPIAASDIRKWAIAVYYPEEPPAEFWDDAAAPGGLVAPEEFNPFAWIAADPPGRRPAGEFGRTIESRLGLPAIETEFMLNGGATMEYGARMQEGDVITATNVLSGYEERTGRLGLMLFAFTTTEWVNQRGELVKSVTNTLIRY